MKIITKSKNFELTASLESFIQEKVGTLKKFTDVLKEDNEEVGKTLAEVFVEVVRETEHHRNGQIFSCQLEMRLPGKGLVVKSSSDDLYKAIIEAKEGLKNEIKKYKVKKIDKNRRVQKKLKNKIIR